MQDRGLIGGVRSLRREKGMGPAEAWLQVTGSQCAAEG